MLIHKGFRFRMKPTKEQDAALRQQGGNTRFLYNLLLERHQTIYQEEHRTWKRNEMINAIPAIKEEHPFLKESGSQSLQQVAIQLNTAFTNFFEKRAEHPSVKKKRGGEDSFTIPQHIKFDNETVQIPKIGAVKWIRHRKIEGTPKSLSISQDGDRWYCSVMCEVEISPPEVKTDDIVGFDLGLKDFGTGSDGTVIPNPKFLIKKEKKLKREQRKLSRKQIRSGKRAKQRAKVSSIHRKVRDARRDFQHQTSARLVKSHDGVAMETLNIKGMVKNHHLAKGIHDVGWGEFVRQVEYKSLWYGKAFIQIDRFYPSSKLCSECGWKNDALTLKDREWVCPVCGWVHDRDLNAAINIEREGRRLLALQSVSNTVGHTEIYARGEGSSGDDHGCRETALDSYASETGKRSATVELKQTPVVGSPRL